MERRCGQKSVLNSRVKSLKIYIQNFELLIFQSSIFQYYRFFNC